MKDIIVNEEPKLLWKRRDEFILVLTHAGRHHSDELAAISMLRAYYKEKTIVVYRITHPNKDFEEKVDEFLRQFGLDLEDMDKIIDLGGKSDGVKYFDHHQYKGGKASAGLVYEFIKSQDKSMDLPALDKLFKIIDAHDTGDKPCSLDSIISLAINIQDDKEDKNKNFKYLSDIFTTFIIKLIENGLELQKAITMINEASFIEGTKLKLLPEDINTKGIYGNSEGLDGDILGAVKYKDDKYVAILFNKEEGSYELITEPFHQDDELDFVHKAGFIAVSSDYEKLEKYLIKHEKRKHNGN